MSIVKGLSLLVFCAALTGCATGYYGDTYHASETKTHKGFRYLVGRGVPQDRAKAAQYFKEAAQEGDVYAQNELAFLYASGKGVAKNNDKAFHWYQRAANKGLASAQYNLGLLYLYGLGTKENKTLALEWIKKSADSGFQPAKETLAQLATG